MMLRASITCACGWQSVVRVNPRWTMDMVEDHMRKLYKIHREKFHGERKESKEETGPQAE